ncbi:MAG: S26 family signal peptidase [Synergistaceae bacterium]|nr:S26 family signal peptidase [Synergistaceae bacterium]MBQ3626320.1 S26 family signal peptidase [Synergistaceae bacterium]MBR0096710.1 S26 family signal peptidase [Synergistaceae bacterium]
MSGLFTFNISSSVPLGLWLRLSNKNIKIGDIVEINFEDFIYNNDWVPEAYYKANEVGRTAPYLKRVAGLPGDVIELGEFNLLKINNKIILNSVILSQDRAGNILSSPDYSNKIKLQDNEVWLMSDSPRGFDSRYLGPAKLNKCVKVLPILIY